jgi:hypothetical protein
MVKHGLRLAPVADDVMPLDGQADLPPGGWRISTFHRAYGRPAGGYHNRDR